jgi:hypothetical protein
MVECVEAEQANHLLLGLMGGESRRDETIGVLRDPLV